MQELHAPEDPDYGANFVNAEVAATMAPQIVDARFGVRLGGLEGPLPPHVIIPAILSSAGGSRPSAPTTRKIIQARVSSMTLLRRRLRIAAAL